MKHFRIPQLFGGWPRASEHGVIVSVRCCDCAGTGTAETHIGSVQCELCDGAGEIEVFEGEIMEVGHA